MNQQIVSQPNHSRHFFRFERLVCCSLRKVFGQGIACFKRLGKYYSENSECIFIKTIEQTHKMAAQTKKLK